MKLTETILKDGFKYDFKAFAERKGNGSAKDPAIVIEKAEANLRDCNRIMQEVGLKGWLLYGTLLGIYRAGELIPHDRDVDMGLYRKDLDKINQMIGRMEKIGFEVIRASRGMFSMLRYDEFMDFNLFERTKNGDFVTYDALDHIPPRITPKKHLETLDTIEHNGSTFYIPNKPEELLERIYGDDWRIPIEGKFAYYYAPKISLITAVNNMADYDRYVLGSFGANQNITIEDGESAAKALNEGIEAAENDICVLCHQDIIFPRFSNPPVSILNFEWKARMSESIYGLDFGVCGLWGIDMDGCFVGHIVEPRGHWKAGELPAKAQSVDELLMIVRKSSGLRFDEKLEGWHLYGADLCLQAMEQGMSNYVIDAPVEHLSMGKIDDAFNRCRDKLAEKWTGRSQIKNYRTPNTAITL